MRKGEHPTLRSFIIFIVLLYIIYYLGHNKFIFIIYNSKQPYNNIPFFAEIRSNSNIIIFSSIIFYINKFIINSIKFNYRDIFFLLCANHETFLNLFTI